MRTEHLLLSLITLILGFLLIGGGLFFLLAPTMTLDFAKIGWISMGCGVLFLLLFSLFMQRRYLLIEMGGLEIHEKVVRHFAKETLEELFPGVSIDCDIIIHRKGKVEILANLPSLTNERLDEVETHLSATLLRYCGYKEAFLFNVNGSSPRLFS